MFKFIVPYNNEKTYNTHLGEYFKKGHLLVEESNYSLKYIISESSLKEYGTIETFECEVFLVPNIENDSIFKKYNRGISRLRVDGADIYIFIHEDVKVLDPQFLQKIEGVFERDEKIGILGIVGTSEFSSMGGWWLSNNPNAMRGHWYQGHSNGLTTYMKKSKVGYFNDMVSVDGLFMAVRGELLKNQKFDENSYPEAYHFYDVDFCFQTLCNGWEVAIEDIKLYHASEGPMGDSWTKSYHNFLKKWTHRGYEFPIMVSSFRGIK